MARQGSNKVHVEVPKDWAQKTDAEKRTITDAMARQIQRGLKGKASA